MAPSIPGVSVLQSGRFPLVSPALHPDGVVVAVHVDDVEVGDGGIALRLPALRLQFFQIGALRIRVDGEDFVGMELVALPTRRKIVEGSTQADA